MLLYYFHNAFTEARNSLKPPNECNDLLVDGHVYLLSPLSPPS